VTERLARTTLKSSFMKPPLRIFGPLLGIAAISACTSSPESSSASGSFEIADSAGVRFVHSHGPQWGDGEAWSVSPEPHQTIGALDGPEEYQLVAVSSATRQSDGDVVIVDDGARTVRLYDREGVFLKTLGGPGSGPGEFQAPGAVLVTNGDTLVVWDQALFRMTRFDSQGGLVGVQAVDLGMISKAVEPPLYPGFVEPLANGRILVRLIEKSGKAYPAGRFRPRSGALRVSADYSIIDTLLFFGDVEQFAVDGPIGRWPVAPPLAKRTWITHQGAPSRICIGDQEGPEIVCFGPDGSRTVLRWASSPDPPTKKEIAVWREANLSLMGQKLSEDDVLQMLDQVSPPATRPDYSQITLDRSGNLWVELGPVTEGTPVWIDYLVFDPVGALLGAVALPPIQVLEIGENYVMGVFRDEFEVEFLQVYELRK